MYFRYLAKLFYAGDQARPLWMLHGWKDYIHKLVQKNRRCICLMGKGHYIPLCVKVHTTQLTEYSKLTRIWQQCFV